MPMENLNLIQKYSGGADTQRSWTSSVALPGRARGLGQEGDARHGRRAAQLYAAADGAGSCLFQRLAVQFEFEDAFEFDETEDQESAIDDVKSDMESRSRWTGCCAATSDTARPRCPWGRVSNRDGWEAGRRTRADHRARLPALPKRFCGAFASFPVTIELLTRYYSAKEQKAI